jgi:hypothetical protein
VLPYFTQTKNLQPKLYQITEGTSFDHLDFFKCDNCQLIIKDPVYRVQPSQEKQVYQAHHNFLEDKGYCDFLSRLINPLIPQLSDGNQGLDFGCGHTKVMAELIKQKGFECVSYDPYFFPETELLKRKYDFITCSEAAEHFYKPDQEFELLFSLLKPNGKLAVMTQLVPVDFASWWYHRDATHVIFYAKETFEWIAQKYGMQLTFYPQSVMILSRD